MVHVQTLKKEKFLVWYTSSLMQISNQAILWQWLFVLKEADIGKRFSCYSDENSEWVRKSDLIAFECAGARCSAVSSNSYNLDV